MSSTAGYCPPSTGVKPAPLILLFYGQGGEASRYLTLAERVPEAAWAFVNYRGYGWSTGFPSERAFFTDAVAVYDYFYTHPLVDADRIVALGGSLGTGVAAYLAAQRALRGVVLFSPYDSISGGVARDLIPLLPTSWLMHNHFHAAQFARNASAPALAVIGEADAVIRPERSLALMEAWAQPAQTFVIPDGTHYSIYDEEASWNAVRAFLADLGII
jgi:pimeloyl-ACP methyl ester carboxylesterase